MKKKLVIALAAILAVSVMAGCSGKGQEETTAAPEQPTAFELETNDDGDVIVEDISITSYMIEGESEPDDEKYAFTYSIEKPIVQITGAAAPVSEIIQAAIEAHYDNIVAFVQDESFGLRVPEMPDASEYESVGFSVLRADNEYISLMIKEDTYVAGAAHGNVNISYLNFYTKTGEAVTFDSISPDFREKAFELVKKEADKLYIQDAYGLYDDYENNVPFVVMDGSERLADYYNQYMPSAEFGTYETIFGDQMAAPTFGITETGFKFTANTYTLAPYAAGILDFDFTNDQLLN